MQVLLLCHQINTLCKWKCSNKEENKVPTYKIKGKKQINKDTENHR